MTNKRSLIILKQLEKKEENELKNLVIKGYRYFYFVEDNNLSKQICIYLKSVSKDVQCYITKSVKDIRDKNCDYIFLSIQQKTMEEKISWAVGGCNLVLSNVTLPKLDACQVLKI